MVQMRSLVAGTILLGALLAGCDNPAMKERAARRADNLRCTCELLAEREAACPEKFGRTLELLEQRHERDIARSAENPAKLQRWLRKDLDRWEGRWPRHRERIQKKLRGDPASIERTLPQMLD